jgi:hypothetical protein
MNVELLTERDLPHWHFVHQKSLQSNAGRRYDTWYSGAKPNFKNRIQNSTALKLQSFDARTPMTASLGRQVIKSKSFIFRDITPRCFLCLAYSSSLKMGATCSSETSVDFHRTTRCYIPQDIITLHNPRAWGPQILQLKKSVYAKSYWTSNKFCGLLNEAPSSWVYAAGMNKRAAYRSHLRQFSSSGAANRRGLGWRVCSDGLPKSRLCLFHV